MASTIDGDEVQISGERHLAEICGGTLHRWPSAKAAVLFGSRARGTHRPDSDWDVASVLEGDEPERARPIEASRFPQADRLMDIDRMDAWAVNGGYLRDHAMDLGTLYHGIARDGRLLAGSWAMPDPETVVRKAGMNPEDWARR